MPRSTEVLYPCGSDARLRACLSSCLPAGMPTDMLVYSQSARLSAHLRDSSALDMSAAPLYDPFSALPACSPRNAVPAHSRALRCIVVVGAEPEPLFGVVSCRRDSRLSCSPARGKSQSAVRSSIITFQHNAIKRWIQCSKFHRSRFYFRSYYRTTAMSL